MDTEMNEIEIQEVNKEETMKRLIDYQESLSIPEKIASDVSANNPD